jgi:ribosomal protein S18 acetylase RimI-like enzyme
MARPLQHCHATPSRRVPPGAARREPSGNMKLVPPVDVRLARHTDVEAVLELWSTAAENASRPADSREAVVALLERDSAALLVADSAGEVIGSIIAGWDGWRGHLYRLAVHPAHRQRGVGGALLAAAEGRLAALSARRFDAMVLDGNERGQQLWRAAGYRRQEEWARWVKPA